MRELCYLLTMITPIAKAENIGEKIGEAYHTDIVVYINNYAIPSYAVNGTSVVVAEDLRNFGFDVAWDYFSRSLTISRSDAITPYEMEFEKNGVPSSKFADLLYTDIKVFANNVQIPSYVISGYTMIPVEALDSFGLCTWIPEERALKLWLDGVHVRSEKQKVPETWNDLTKEEAINLVMDYCIDPYEEWDDFDTFEAVDYGDSYEVYASYNGNYWLDYCIYEVDKENGRIELIYPIW